MESDSAEDSGHSFSDSGGPRPTELTTNNQAASGDYNLRPRRSKRLFAVTESPLLDSFDKSNSPTENSDPNSETVVSLPSKKKKKSSSSRGAGSNKSKAPPLSKYRRRTANARERNRMQEINMAFERLRNAVPQLPPSNEDASPVQSPCPSQKGGRKSRSADRKNEETDENGKMTKITTLRLAVNYIAALSQILSQSQREYYSKPGDVLRGQSVDSVQINAQEGKVPIVDAENGEFRGSKVVERVSSLFEPAESAINASLINDSTTSEYFLSSEDQCSNAGETLTDNQPGSGSESGDPNSVINEEDLRGFEEEYCGGDDPLTDDDLALIPDEAFMRELFSLHSDTVGSLSADVFRLVETHQHNVVDFV